MNLADEQEECFESETGAPTLTVIASDHQRMLAYSSFCDALMEGNRITLRFRDWHVVISGESLGVVWKQFQMQDVRVIRVSNAGTVYGCKISGIEIREIKED